MIWGILFLFITIGSLYIHISTRKEEDDRFHFGAGVGYGMGLLLMIACFIYANNDIPTAKDVVDGKTILKVKKNVDGMPIDTIIVLKDEYKKNIKFW